ncbi:MAG TPA: hypothetical protein VF081_02905 [Solirubrobacterales bacterium]
MVLLGVYVIESGSEGTSAFQPVFPEGGPAEFLYLDTARVATYLSQVEGGEVESEKLSRKLTQSLNAKVALEGKGEIGATQATELAAERILKPTAASSFFALQTRLMDVPDVVKEIDSEHFERDVKGLREGQFVDFTTDALQSPIYLNAYFAVLHAGTLAAIFPGSHDDREAAKNFFEKVGPTARAVFSLQQPAPSTGGVASGDSQDPESEFVFLLPVTAPLLSSERSLLKYGGGEFKVFGKLVRRFPEPEQDLRKVAYVDSATKETWGPALKGAPGELLCRTAPDCAGEIRGEEASERDDEIARNRRKILEALGEQTIIPERGAVILPIAIYK